ncbi:MAG: chromosome partitioning ATPase [Candidatus Bathyarchaeota archaeon B23]|nr:MAG: chromosome partitioning ATPase [Candidatus Bathyarchaeota archaeon B23]
MKAISVHSSRGGTGKTLLSYNLAAIYASEGKAVSLLDFDFRAPSLSTLFRVEVKRWLNDYLDGDAGAEEVIVDISNRIDVEGRLLVGLANPEMEAMREMARKDRRWQVRALRRMMELKRRLEEMDVDVVVFDTSPGIHYSSVNAVVSSDISLLISTMDVVDLEGARRLIRDIYDAFERRVYIIVNKAIPYQLATREGREELVRRISRYFKYPLLAIIPCYCDLLLKGSRRRPFVLERRDHPFSKVMREIARRLEGL